MGRLTRDPETRQAQEILICRFSIAVQRRGNDQADFINCTAFGKNAENIAKYFKKGDRILVTGRWTTSRYEAADGTTRTSNDCIVDTWEFIETKKDKSEKEKTAKGEEKGVDPDDFMRIPDGIEEELPFN